MLRRELRLVEDQAHRNALSTAGSPVAVDTSAAPCPLCDGRMNVQKSANRTLITLEHGQFVAWETFRVCAARCRYPSGQLVTRRSGHLDRLAPPHALCGYDVELFVGMARFVRHRQREEIRHDLLTRYGITVSTGEVSALGRRFLRHLHALHVVRSPALRRVLETDGGYPLHLDATGETGRGTFLIAYAGWRQWVLGSWKISSERADLIEAALDEVAALFGLPCAIVRDMGKAITPATHHWAARQDRPVRVLICHAHFLDDVGTDLLAPTYDELRRLIRRFSIRSGLRKLARDLGRKVGSDLAIARNVLSLWMKEAEGHCLPEGLAGLAAVRMLCQWVLDYASDGQNLGFPFERPYLDLCRRCQIARRAADAYLRRGIADQAVQRSLKRLVRVVDPVFSEVPFTRVMRTLQRRANLFDQLRNILRLDGDDQAHSRDADCEESPSELEVMQHGLESFTSRLKARRPQRGPAKDECEAINLILEHLDRHGAYLWGHVIQLPEGADRSHRLVARTNNILEGFNRHMKHNERRRSGRKILTQDLEHLPAEAALAANLSRPDYIEALCGSLDRLPACFSELDTQERHQALMGCVPQLDTAIFDDEIVSVSFPMIDRRLVRQDRARDRIEAAAQNWAPNKDVVASI